MDYAEFLASKRMRVASGGFDVRPEAINPLLFPFQRDVVRWAVRKGRAAVWVDTGLGKTFIQVEWARLIGGVGIIIAPLSVARQTVREGAKLGIEVHYTRSSDDLIGGINITNYEMIEHFDPSVFRWVVLDESSLIKCQSGKTRTKLIEMFGETLYRLCCTATPAPNDYVELGNHAEFLGVCTEAEMRAMFFINANKDRAIELDGQIYTKKGSNKGGTEWRLKRAAESPFFAWLASWSISLTKPSDLGYDDDGFILPPLHIIPHYVEAAEAPEGQLFFTHLHGIQDRAKVRRSTIDVRLEALTELIKDDLDQWVIWVGLDAEQRAVEKLLGERCVSIYGSLSPEDKEQRLEQWLSGEKQILLSKVRVCGFGLNLQQAHKMAFVGLSDSWESWYQAIRREWRYKQTHPVEVHVILSDQETEIYANIQRKEALAARLRRQLIERIRTFEEEELAMSTKEETPVETATVETAEYKLMMGDSCDRLREIAEASIDLSVYSPPFADLFTYTDSSRDLGNSRGWPEFFRHYSFIVREVLRVTKPGRLTCVHTSDIPAMLERDGYIGLRDFPGEVIRAHEAAGWIFHGRAFVQKNPQQQAIRVKSKALLFVQLRKDSTDSRPALIDQVLIFKKPGVPSVPVSPVGNGEMDNDTWIEWAHGIWLGIRETDTLQAAEGRDSEADKHICPLQLGTIERCIKLYSNPNETVLDPFNGIGSTGYVAISNGRRYVGIELKKSYFRVAVKNLQRAETQSTAVTLFDFAASAEGLPEGRAS